MNVNGTITLNADFGTKKLDGSMTVKNASNNSTWATASFNNINIQNSNRKESMVFNGQLTDSEISGGAIRGEFFGKKAAETGGIWSIDKNGVDKASGVFRAKKQ